jgi:TonB family protein
MSLVLLCLLELPHAWSQHTEEAEQLPVLGSKEATRLILSQAPPEYPVLAKVNYIQGRVRVQFVVSAAGTVASAHVLGGNPLLAAAVLNSVHRWLYRPYVVAGSATAFVTTAEIRFMLDTKKLDLNPKQAESDFCRQVKPPEVLTGRKETDSADPLVRMRLLVSAEGKVIDSEILKGVTPEIERARKIIERWSFRPARWGTLSVPWYLDVDVPIDQAPVQAGLGSPTGR